MPGAMRAITPNPSGHITNEDEPLDWGSDDEKYTSFLSSYTHFAYSMTAFHHPLRGLRDGGFKDAGITVLQSAPHTPQQNGRAEC